MPTKPQTKQAVGLVAATKVMKNAAVPSKARTKQASGQAAATRLKSEVMKTAAVPTKANTKQAPGQARVKGKVVKSGGLPSKAKMKGRPAATGAKMKVSKKPALGRDVAASIKSQATKNADASTKAKIKQVSVQEADAGGSGNERKNAVARSKKKKQASSEDAATGGGSGTSKSAAVALDIKAPDAALLAAYAEAAGPTAGDAVFAHPLVMDLLVTARRQVLAVLRQQKCPVDEKWLVCIRTYGRARPLEDSDLYTCLKRLGKKMEKIPAKHDLDKWTRKFSKAGIGTYTELVEALQKPDELRKRIAEIPDENQIHSKVLERLAKATSEHEAKTLKAKGMHRGLLDLTLKSLELALGEEACQHCLIFVSHEDADYTSGRYHEALAGTPWQKRIVVGVKGAHHQVRFIEEAAPVGTHLVVADDKDRKSVV